MAVRRMLGDPRYAKAARELGEWSERPDGAAIAATAVEQLASAPDVYPRGVQFDAWQPKRAATPPPRTS